jgi:hypothetical protein
LSKEDEVDIKFGTGEIKSNLIRDDVCIGIEENSLCLEKFLFLSAFDLSEEPFKEVDFDGIIGLGLSDLSVSPQSNFLENLFKSKKISKKMFAFYFRKNLKPLTNSKHLYKNIDSIYEYKEEFQDKLSELFIGGIDFDRIKGDIFFNEIISKKYWEVKLDNIYYGNTKLPFCNDRECTAIIDSGTSTLGFSNEFENVFKILTNFKNNCSNLNSLKALIFQIGGIFYELDPIDYTMKLKNSSPNKIEYLTPDENVEEK